MQGQILSERCIVFTKEDGLEWCKKLIRLKAVGTALYVELVKKAPNGGEEVRVLAQLPQETYYVSEPYFGEFFVAYENGKLIAAAWSWGDWRDLLRKLKARGYYVARSNYLSASKIVIPYVKKTVSAGLSEDGKIVDPLGILDKNDYGAEPLKATYEWIKLAYAGKNAEYAWYNVIAAITHVATSPLRTPSYLRNHFLDYVVYNVLPYGYGAIMYVLERLLYGRDPYNDYGTVIYGEPLKADLGSKRLAAELLDLNRLSLVMMGQTKKTLKIYKYVLESFGGGFIELDRQGKKRIPNLRGLIIFADDLHNIPAPRRLVLRWDLSSIRQPQTAPPPIEPIYGFAARLWKKYRDLFTANKLPYLVAAVGKAVAREISDEAEEVATFTERTIDKLTNAFMRVAKLDDAFLS
jgi:hypothetical protein